MSSFLMQREDKREKIDYHTYKGMYNGVMSAFPYGCHVRYLLSWRRENGEREGCLSLAKR
jgi:hypothetical protein